MSGPFHEGEEEAQARVGRAAETAALGRRMIRDHVDPRLAPFYAGLPMLPIAAMDAEGRILPSILFGPPGFVSLPEPRRLRVAARPDPRDPLAGALAEGMAIGAIGVDLATRRRNRVNGALAALEADGLSIAVRQAFGNCPKYIQLRAPAPRPGEGAPARESDRLSPRGREIVAASDLFFLGSGVPGAGDGAGADMSHRGGRPGFVRIEGEQGLAFPDYPGNNLFNSLGNLAVNPQAGLAFLDAASGDALLLRGRAAVDWSAEARAGVPGAERLVRFEVASETLLPAAAPLSFAPPEYSPALAAIGA